ncbi:MAG: beta-L-arabinofuranosidase domain-containing protein [Kiritimatiellia bacterium]
MKSWFALVATLAAASAGAAVELCPLSQVRISRSSLFAPAVAADIAYMKTLDCDRLLAPFRREAGLPKRADSYGNWENCGLDGHTLGHYLSALANLIAAGEDRDGELKRRLAYVVDELAACQAAHGDGRLDGVPNGAAVWAAMRRGDPGLVWKRWVPWYNLHKTFAGLRDACELAGQARARELLVKLADWAIEVTGRLDEGAMQRMLGQEYGGMNETLADLYGMTGDRKYLDAAYRWEHRQVFDPLYRHEDRLSGLHANTQIPKFVGLARTAQLTHDEARWDAADFAWRTIVTRRSVAFGGNSVGEHFHALDSFEKLMGDREGPETCNTYNMLRLTERLFEHEPRAEYAAYYERALFNHILPSINVEHPGFVYFTPTRPGHYRVYSTPTNCFWCCVGTGMENPGRYGRFVYAYVRGGAGGTDRADGFPADVKEIYVNLFVDSELKGVLRQRTNFPEGGETEITFLRPFAGTLRIRVGDRYVAHRGAWKRGDTVRASRPMDWHVEKLPDGSDWGAILRGPIVMGRNCGTGGLDGLFADDARMGHVAYGPLADADQVECRDADAPLDTAGLVPFYRLHECRYQIYWEFASAGKLAARKAALEQAAAAERERDRRTRDRLAPGEQQPETEHDLSASPDSAKGYHAGRHWRHGSWFEYTLDPRGARKVALEATYWGGDCGRTFDVLANGVVLRTVTLDGRHGNRFRTETYPVPEAAMKLRADGKLRIRFEATQGGLAGGLFGLRLLEAR